MSRADLARASGLTPTTVSNVIGELVDEGMIEEAGRTLSGSVGKPATLVSVVADARHVVCLDLSCAGEIRGAVVNLARKVVARRSVRRREASGAVADRPTHRHDCHRDRRRARRTRPTGRCSGSASPRPASSTPTASSSAPPTSASTTSPSARS